MAFIFGHTGLPKIPMWVNLEGLGMGSIEIFLVHLENFTAIWYILLAFG
jgi:hypothetical protein